MGSACSGHDSRRTESYEDLEQVGDSRNASKSTPDGTIPNDFRITEESLEAIRSDTSSRNSGEGSPRHHNFVTVGSDDQGGKGGGGAISPRANEKLILSRQTLSEARKEHKAALRTMMENKTPPLETTSPEAGNSPESGNGAEGEALPLPELVVPMAVAEDSSDSYNHSNASISDPSTSTKGPREKSYTRLPNNRSMTNSITSPIGDCLLSPDGSKRQHLSADSTPTEKRMATNETVNASIPDQQDETLRNDANE